MAVLGEYLHINGLKFGLYSDAGYRTCGGMAASLGYESIDLDQESVYLKTTPNSRIFFDLFISCFYEKRILLTHFVFCSDEKTRIVKLILIGKTNREN